MNKKRQRKKIMAIAIVLISKPSHSISCLFKQRRYSVWTQMLQYPNAYSEFLSADDANVRRGCGCLRHLYRNFCFRIKNLRSFWTSSTGRNFYQKRPFVCTKDQNAKNKLCFKKYRCRRGKGRRFKWKAGTESIWPFCLKNLQND